MTTVNYRGQNYRLHNTIDEIIQKYKRSDVPDYTIQILAELNAVPVNLIYDILKQCDEIDDTASQVKYDERHEYLSKGTDMTTVVLNDKTYDIPATNSEIIKLYRRGGESTRSIQYIADKYNMPYDAIKEVIKQHTHKNVTVTKGTPRSTYDSVNKTVNREFTFTSIASPKTNIIATGVETVLNDTLSKVIEDNKKDGDSEVGLFDRFKKEDEVMEENVSENIPESVKEEPVEELSSEVREPIAEPKKRMSWNNEKIIQVARLVYEHRKYAIVLQKVNELFDINIAESSFNNLINRYGISKKHVSDWLEKNDAVWFNSFNNSKDTEYEEAAPSEYSESADDMLSDFSEPVNVDENSSEPVEARFDESMYDRTKSEENCKVCGISENLHHITNHPFGGTSKVNVPQPSKRELDSAPGQYLDDETHVLLIKLCNDFIDNTSLDSKMITFGRIYQIILDL
jgi:hypothetical protein